MISTSELSKRLRVSSSAVLEHYKAHSKELANHTRISHHKRVFDDKGVSILVSTFNKRNGKPKANKNSLLLIKVLRQQLVEKDKQIKNLNVELRQQQTLQLAEVKKNKELTYKVNRKGLWTKIKQIF